MTEADDRQTIRAMIVEDYAMLSGPPGPRPYDAVKHHYHREARLVRTGVDEDGRLFCTVMTVDDHHADVDQRLGKISFVEEEIDHQCDVFGDVARVKSVYRYQYGDGARARTGRGVNFYNFIRENGTWKIISIVWGNERPGLALGTLEPLA